MTRTAVVVMIRLSRLVRAVGLLLRPVRVFCMPPCPRDSPPVSTTAPTDGARKKRSRWGDAVADMPGMPTAINAEGVSQAQLDNYAIQLRLEEINRKLRLNNYVPPENERYERKCILTDP